MRRRLTRRRPLRRRVTSDALRPSVRRGADRLEPPTAPSRVDAPGTVPQRRGRARCADRRFTACCAVIATPDRTVRDRLTALTTPRSAPTVDPPHGSAHHPARHPAHGPAHRPRSWSGPPTRSWSSHETRSSSGLRPRSRFRSTRARSPVGSRAPLPARVTAAEPHPEPPSAVATPPPERDAARPPTPSASPPPPAATRRAPVAPASEAPAPPGARPSGARAAADDGRTPDRRGGLHGRARRPDRTHPRAAPARPLGGVLAPRGCGRRGDPPGGRSRRAAHGVPRPGARGGAADPAEHPVTRCGVGAEPEVVVDVVGAVSAPGVVRLADGSRVVDALAAVGGATGEADVSALNLARVLVDGEQIVVPRPGDVTVVLRGRHRAGRGWPGGPQRGGRGRPGRAAGDRAGAAPAGSSRTATREPSRRSTSSRTSPASDRPCSSASATRCGSDGHRVRPRRHRERPDVDRGGDGSDPPTTVDVRLLRQP